MEDRKVSTYLSLIDDCRYQASRIYDSVSVISLMELTKGGPVPATEEPMPRTDLERDLVGLKGYLKDIADHIVD